jgi:hypothetical protein
VESVLGPNQYSQAASKVTPSGKVNNTVQSSILQPILPPSQAHGYIESGIDTQSHLHPHLRSANSGLASGIMQRAASSTSEELGPVSGSPTATTMAAQGIIGHEHDDGITDGRKARRELSQSKRAAQNRAAQVSMRFYFCPSNCFTGMRSKTFVAGRTSRVADGASLRQSYTLIPSLASRPLRPSLCYSQYEKGMAVKNVSRLSCNRWPRVLH